MSPEQASGQSSWATPASDIFSLGVVLYELLAEQLPFRATTRQELFRQIREKCPAVPSSIHRDTPKGVEDVCLAALSKEPHARPRSAHEMARSLHAAMRPRPWWLPWVGPIVALLAAGALLVFYMLWWKPQDEALKPRVAPMIFEVWFASEKGGVKSPPLGELDVRNSARFSVHAATDRKRDWYYLFVYCASTPKELAHDETIEMTCWKSWPPSYDASHQQVTELNYPYQAGQAENNFWSFPDPEKDGPVLILAAAADERLPEDSFNALRNYRFSVTGNDVDYLRDYALRDAFPRPRDWRPEDGVFRGGKELDEFKNVAEISPDLKKLARQLLATHYMVMFFHHNPQGNQKADDKDKQNGD